MKIVVVGSTGRIGQKLVKILHQEDCRVFEASPTHGVDAVTGTGLADAMTDAEIVVDVSNSPALDGPAPLHFFETVSRNLLAAGRAVGVRHHIILSIVGTDGLVANDYFRAKKLQEDLVKAAGIPFTIVRSTQFFEFISDVVQEGTTREIAISPALVQPIASEDVADVLTGAIFSAPLHGTLEVAGPEQFRLDEVVRRYLAARKDPRQVIADPHARYYGIQVSERSLVPADGARLGKTHFEDWLRQSAKQASKPHLQPV